MSLPPRGRQGWFRVWCRSTTDLLLFQFKRFAIFAWVALVIAVAIGFYRIENLAHENSRLVHESRRLASENKQRIAEIQESRFQGCEAIYKSFHAVFDPFLPPPDKRTARQKRDFRKFNAILDKKIRQCRKQVTLPAPTK